MVARPPAHASRSITTNLAQKVSSGQPNLQHWFNGKSKSVPVRQEKNEKPALERAWEGEDPCFWCRGWESIPRPRTYEPKIGFFKNPSKRPSYEYYLLDVYDKVRWNFLKSSCQHLLTIVYQTFPLFSETAKRLSKALNVILD
jgi:hypothetical protein